MRYVLLSLSLACSQFPKLEHHIHMTAKIEVAIYSIRGSSFLYL